MYKVPTYSWVINPVCGPMAAAAYGDGGDYPFLLGLSTAPSWQCAKVVGWAVSSVTITCSLYQPTKCNSGTFSPTGVATYGDCFDKCPSNLPYSPKGSTSISQCFTLYNNIYAVSDASNRVTALNTDTKQFELVTEVGVIDKPYDMEFITENLALVSSFTKHTVNMIDSEGIDHGVFATMNTPMGILHLPHLNLVAIASAEPIAKEVLFFNLDDYHTGTPLQMSDATSITTNTLGAGRPQYLSLGEFPDEILITTSDAKVVRMCIPNTGCKIRNTVMIKYGGRFRGIAIIPARESYIVVDRIAGKLFECPLTTTNTDVNIACTVFAHEPAGDWWNPFNLVADHTKNLIYVADYQYHTVHVMTFDKDYLGPLHDSLGALMTPNALAIKAGPLPSLSSVSPPATAIAGSPINVPLALRDAYNNPLPDSYPIATELPLFKITATGLRDGLPTTLTGVISSSTLATITIPYAGAWNVTVTSSLANPQTLHNGAFQIEVKAAVTDPAECEAEFEQAITAGEEFALDVTTMDAYKNPTTGAEFEFSCCVGEAMIKSGEYTVRVTPAIKGNPFRFDVSPAPPSPLDCEQSLEGVTAFDPSTGANLTLQVFAFDEFKNLVPDTDRLIVVIDGDINSAIPLLPPMYTHEFHFQPDEMREIKIGVLLKKDGGTPLTQLPGSPVLIQVAPVLIQVAPTPPPASTTIMWIIFCCTLPLILLANYFFNKHAHKKIEVNAERKVSVDEKLRKLLNNKIRMQNGMVLIEIGDVGSDTLNGVLKLLDLLNGADDVVPWLWVLFVVVAAVAVPLGVYQITNRARVKSSYRAIINGTDEELLKALDENSDVISVESIKIRRTLVALDLSVAKLGLRGLYIEDVPSLVANAVAIVYVMAQGTIGTKSTYATLAAFMFSCGMAGRKSGLRTLERDLAQKKGELEALENMDEVAKENRADILRQQSEIANLQDDLRKKKHSEDELAVMKAAMDGLEEKRKDELKEVLISSSEVKVSRLLGKGGFGVVNLATYRGQQIAMKQLLTINDESVKRFR